MALGHPVLKAKAENIDFKTLDVKTLVADMFETMYNASGVGLAAPQIGKGIRLFVIDAEPMDEETLAGTKMVFVNPLIVEEAGTPWPYEEGCLSLPGIREEVKRPEQITLKYQDETGAEFTKKFEGLLARVIQHEYDHIEGKLFIDHLKPLKRSLLKGRLEKISKGMVEVSYKMKFPKK